MDRGATLAHLAWGRAGERPDAVAYVHVRDGDGDELALPWRELDRRARAVAARLVAQAPRGATPAGERALLLFPHGLDFPCALLGCFYARVVGVPTNPPGSARRPLERTAAIARDAELAFVLTTRALCAAQDAIVAHAPELAALPWIAVDELPAGAEHERDAAAALLPRPDDLALLQYTSGSTGTPRGVMVSHANALHNVERLRLALFVERDSVLVSWLPFHHDMGLVGMLLATLYTGPKCVLLSPAHFLEKPLRWLQAVTRHRATMTGAPDFAFDLCAARAAREPEALAALELSSVRRLFSGSEPIRAPSLERFLAAFAPRGLRAEALVPGYGLAEATLVVSASTSMVGARVFALERRALDAGRAVPCDAGSAEPARALVGCGPPLPGVEVAIVDPETARARPDDTAGEVWVRGPSVARGYWRDPQASRATFHARLADADDAGGWLRTGDLGLLHQGELCLCGRLKDLIIVRGENHHPQDIERAAETAHEALRPGGGAAFADAQEEGPERLVLVHEVRRAHGFDADAIVTALVRAVAGREGVELDVVLLIPPGALPKTTSGKVRRRATRSAWKEGRLPLSASWTRPREAELALLGERTPEAIAGWLAERVARALGTRPEALDARAPLGALGIDSLAMTELVHALHDALGQAPPLARLFQGASIEELAAEACALASRAAASFAQAAQRGYGAEHTAAPFDAGALTHGQRALWFLHALAPESAAYNLAAALRVCSPTTPQELERAFAVLAARHAVLRTTFHEGPAGRPRRVVHDELPIEFLCIDARALSADELRGHASAAARLPFDLERGPLLRVRWYARAGEPDVCLVATHHVALDHWSFATLLEELALLHDGLELEPLSRGWDDYLRAEQAAEASGAWQAAWQYWRTKLAAPPAALELQGELPGEPGRGPARRGATLTRRLSADTTAALRAFAAARGLTPFVVALAAFEALLHRASGSEDFLLATLGAGRADPRFAALVGYLVNPVVLRADFSGAPSFDELLARTRADVAHSFEHGALPFARLVEELHPERDPSGTPFVRALFAWQNALQRRGADLSALALGLGGARIRLGGLVVETLALEQQSAQFDVTLSAGLVEGTLALALEVDAERFGAAATEQLLDRYERLLGAVLERPLALLRSIDLVSEAERARLRELGRGPRFSDDTRGVTRVGAGSASADSHGADAPGACEPLVAAFARAARQHPARTALVGEGRAWSYAELALAVAALARSLAAEGVATGTLVGLELPRSPELALGILAVAACGATWMPIDPALPAARRAELRGLAARVLAKVRLDAAPADARAARDACDELETRARAVVPEAPAYQLFTSGSTGRPKGVLVSHHALAIHGRAAREHFALAPEDRVLHMAAIGFDLSLEELLPPLLAGASVLVWQRPAPPSVAELEGLVAERAVTVLDLPTVYWHEWMRIADEEGRALPAGLRLLIVGGERASAAALRVWRRLAPPSVRWVNTYGPTEATVTTTLFDAAEEAGELDPIPIGRPVAGQRVVVLDAFGWPAPLGAAGELGIGGECLAQGYADLPARTAEAFVPDPLADPGAGGARLYKSGDRVRFDAHGRLLFLGRRDDQVKVRGVRVEPGEVEARLLAHASVAEACVLAHAGLDGATRLCAWVVPRTDALDPEELRAFVAEALPSAFVPAELLVRDALPCTPHGKLDRAALLAELAESEREGLREHVLERAAQSGDEAERALAAIWSELLARADVGRHDDFFALGGDSIQSIQAAARAARAGLHLTPAEIFRHRTIAALARVARRAQPAPEQDWEHASVAGPLPLAPIQRWFFALAPHEPSHWNLSVWLELPEGIERIERVRLAQALARLVERHDALRLCFERAPDGWRARVLPSEEATPEIAEHSVGSVQEAERLAAELQRTLDLEHGPLFAAALVRQPGSVRLLAIAHHLIVDAVSWRVLADELVELFAGRDPGPAPLPWSAHARAFAPADGAPPERWSTWLRRLSEVPRLPHDLPRDDGGSDTAGDEATLASELARETSEALRAAGQRAHASLEELLAAALVHALAEWSGTGPVALELEGHGRGMRDERAPDRSRTVGWFTELTPLVVDVRASDGPVELLRAVKRELAALPGGRGAWFRARYGPDPAAAAALAVPAPEVSLNFLGELAPARARALGLALERPSGQRSPHARRTHALELDAWLGEGRLHLSWTYARTRHAARTLERLDAATRDALAALAHGPLAHGPLAHGPLAHGPLAQGIGAAALSGADFPLAGLSDADLAKVLTQLARP